MNRRDFLKILGVASGATLLTSCGVEKGTEKIIPFLVPPDDNYIPGEAMYYASTCTECPASCGISVRVREFNPVKLEGIENHPVNDGALCVRGQSSIMRLYHPDRIKKPLQRDASGKWVEISWEAALQRIQQAMQEARRQGRENIYLTGHTTGSLLELQKQFAREMGVTLVPSYEPLAPLATLEANRLLFNQPEVPDYRIDRADFLLTVGADVLETFVSPVKYASRLGKVIANDTFHWAHVEANASLTGFQADQRLTIQPGTEPYLLLFLLRFAISNKFVKQNLPTEILAAFPDWSEPQLAEKCGLPLGDLNRLAQALVKARHPLILTGGVSTSHRNGLQTAVLTALLQWAMGMVGDTVVFSNAERFENLASLKDMAQLSQKMETDAVGVFLVSRTDPVGQLPGSVKFAESMARASLRVAMTDLMNETAEQCDIILPLSHALESWGDAQPNRTTWSVIQPAVEPLYDTLSEGDILLKLLAPVNGASEKEPTYQEWLFQRWNRQFGAEQVSRLLEEGYLTLSPENVRIRLLTESTANFLAKAQWHPAYQTPVLVVTPSLRSYDGRSRVLPLLQEIPDPITSISYGQWVSVSRKTAQKMGLKNNDQLRLTINGKEMYYPVRVQPGLPDGVLQIQRDMMPLQELTFDEQTGLEINYFENIAFTPTGFSQALAILAGSDSQHGRNLVPEDDHHDHGEAAHHGPAGEHPTLYPEHEHKDYRWAMAIDLEKCVGCAACVAACYVENNVPMVGEAEHLKGREMSWIRIEPFYDDHENMNHLLMLCQQCDHAPCEPVCPVYATHHNQEGLNVQVYNRCVGTRYCSNNCPYKVRRFNWFDHKWPEPLNRMLNPDVSVRGRGIMEKCTFCIQRIRNAKDIAKDEGRLVQDGEVIPACAQTCPTEAIVFGNLLDENSRISQLARDERSYHVLEELGTRPAVFYLRKKEKVHES